MIWSFFSLFAAFSDLSEQPEMINKRTTGSKKLRDLIFMIGSVDH
jgi:hypothetical protein